MRKKGDVKEILLSGLRRMEYRGYDSAGIAIAGSDRILMEKKLGRLDNLEKALAKESQLPESSIGLGHTRWATHGAPSDRNAHPHHGCDSNLVVIHNGILENYLEIKEELLQKGHRFVSETDSEVFAHLIEETVKQAKGKENEKISDLGYAVTQAVRRARGAYALVVLHRSFPDRLVVARKESPIVLGISEDAGFIGSDVPAFLPYTNRALYLHDGELAEILAGKIHIYAVKDLKEVKREEVLIHWTSEEAEKRGYPHFMIKEIFEQPEVLARTAFDRLHEEQGDVEFEDFSLSSSEIRNFQKIQLLACGTALHACLVAKFWLEKLARIPVEVDFASEYRYRDPIVDSRVLAIAVSQSGETADTIGAVKEAGRRGAKTLGICNVMGASLSREVESVLLTHAGPEIGVASTKAFLAQLVALYMLSIRLGRARGSLDRAEGQKRIRELRVLRSRLEQLLQNDQVKIIEQAAKDFSNAKGFLFLGRGLHYPIALEGALKLKEISYLHAEGYPAGEMKHGPIALIEPELPVVAIAPPGAVYDKMRSNMQEVKARGGQLIVLGDPNDKSLRKEASRFFALPETAEDLTPMTSVVPLQLFAYYVALARGCDIDKPRNLAKSVTVE